MKTGSEPSNAPRRANGLATSPTLETLSITNPESHAKTPIDAAMIRKT